MTTPNQQLPEPPDFASPIASEERDGYRALDALGPGWIAVLSASTATPPASPAQGDRYLVPVGASGVWATHARHIAYFTPVGWGYRAPRRGWVALALDEGADGFAYTYSGTKWARMPALAFDFSGVSALDIEFAGYGLPGDPMTVDAALEKLFDLVGSGGGGGGSSGITLIASQTLGSTASTVTFGGIPQGYTSLEIVYVTNTTSQSESMYMQFNGDTAAHYDFGQTFGFAGSGFSGGGGSLNSSQVELASMPAQAVFANQGVSGRIFIPHYTNTAFYKEAFNHTGRRDSNAFYNQNYHLNWHSTAAITDILLGVPTTAFVVGSRFSLYGID